MKYTCEINEEVQIELTKSAKRNSIIAIVAGIVGLIAYVGLSMWKELFVFEVLLWVSAIVFALGLVCLLTINKIVKQAGKSNIVGEYELEETSMMITAIKDGEQISTAKVYYKDIVKVRETQNYLFLYTTKQIAYPVPKSKLTPEEFSMIKLWVSAAKAKK